MRNSAGHEACPGNRAFAKLQNALGMEHAGAVPSFVVVRCGFKLGGEEPLRPERPLAIIIPSFKTCGRHVKQDT